MKATKFGKIMAITPFEVIRTPILVPNESPYVTSY